MSTGTRISPADAAAWLIRKRGVLVLPRRYLRGLPPRKGRHVIMTKGPNGHLAIEFWSQNDPQKGKPGTGFRRTFDPWDWPIAAAYYDRVQSGKRLHLTEDCHPSPEDCDPAPVVSLPHTRAAPGRAPTSRSATGKAASAPRLNERHVVATRGPNGHHHIEFWSQDDPQKGRSGTGYLRTFEPGECSRAAAYYDRLKSGKKLYCTHDGHPPSKVSLPVERTAPGREPKLYGANRKRRQGDLFTWALIGRQFPSPSA